MPKIKKQSNKILIIGDLHLRISLGYAENIKDGRKQEYQDVLNCIIENSKNCNKIIFLGDNFNYKNNPAIVVREFTSLLERLGDKDIYILAGNHEINYSTNEVSTAISYLKEISNKKWHIIEEITQINDYVFCPYITKTKMETETNEDGAKKLLTLLPKGKILFCHQSLSNININGQNTDFFPEIVLPQKELSKKYEKVFAGHLHQNNDISNKLIIVGSIFCNEVGEKEKFIYTLDEDTLETTKISLPVRQIIKLENPTEEEIKSIPNNSIVKIIITKEKTIEEINIIKELLENTFSENGAYIFLEQIPQKRIKIHYDKKDDLLSFSTEQLLEIYSKTKNIDFNKLILGFQLIKL